MRRRVSMWVVVALVGALAATTAAVVVLATNDDGGSAPGGMTRSGNQGPWQMPVMGEERHAWGDDRESALLPWLLFAIATGTAAGLLVAWSPWRRTPAPAVAGSRGHVATAPDVMAVAPVEATTPVEALATPVEMMAEDQETATRAAEAVAGPSVPDVQATAHGAGTEMADATKPQEKDAGADTA